MAENLTATLTVERTEVLRTGTKNDKPWVLYAVHGKAIASDGSEIGLPIRTFDQFAPGEYVGVTLEPYHNGSDTLLHYTAKGAKVKKQSKRHGGDGEVAELRERLERLERKVNALIGDPDIIIPEQTGVH